MRRLRATVIASLGATLSLPLLAHADRAVAPSDGLDGGNIEVGARLETDRGFRAVDGADSDTRARDSLAGAELFVRAWLADQFFLGLSQTGFFARTAHEDGIAADVDAEGLSALAVSTGLLVGRGRFDLGGSLALTIPNSGDFDLQQFDASARAIAGYSPASIGGETFAVADYVLRNRELSAESADRVIVTLGYHRRLANLSLVPSASFERVVSSAVEEAASSTVRGSVLVAYELIPNLTCTALVEGAAELAHRVGTASETSGHELALGLGVSYAWDTERMAQDGGSPPDPAAIAVVDVDGGDGVARALRAQIPALRRNTLDAERRAGGADGTMRVTLTLRPDGRVESADVIDAIGSPELVEAVEHYFRRLILRSNAARIAFTLVFANDEG